MVQIMIESHRELSTSLPWGAENVSENPCANSLVFAEKSFETESYQEIHSLRMELCRIPTGTGMAEVNLGSLEGLDTWSCPALGVLVQHWDLLLKSELTQTHRAKGTNPSHVPDLCLIFVENIIYQLLFLA